MVPSKKQTTMFLQRDLFSLLLGAGVVSGFFSLFLCGRSLKRVFSDVRLTRQLEQAKNSGSALDPLEAVEKLAKGAFRKPQGIWKCKENSETIKGLAIFKGEVVCDHPIPSNFDSKASLIYQRVISEVLFDSKWLEKKGKVSVLETQCLYFGIKNPLSTGKPGETNQHTMLVERLNTMDVSEDSVKFIGERRQLLSPQQVDYYYGFFNKMLCQVASFGLSIGTCEREFGITTGTFGFLFGKFLFDKRTKELRVTKPLVFAGHLGSISNPIFDRISRNLRVFLVSLGLFGFSAFVCWLLWKKIQKITKENPFHYSRVPFSYLQASKSLTCDCGRAQKCILGIECGHLVECQECFGIGKDLCGVCNRKTAFKRIYVA